LAEIGGFWFRNITMPYPFQILKNEKILATPQDVEIFIRHILGKHFFIVERTNLDQTKKRFELHFWQRHIGLDRYVNDGEIGKVYWGGAEIIEWSDSTEIIRMWAVPPEDWYVGEFGLDKDKVMEERFEWLKELGDEIREKFEILSPEQVNTKEVVITVNQKKGYHALTLKQLDSIVHNTLLIFRGFEVERLEEGSNIFYTVFSNLEFDKVLLGKYRVWEWHDGSGRSGWMPSNDISPEIEKLRHGVWQAITAVAMDAMKDKFTPIEQAAISGMNSQKIKGGRPRNVDDDWAYEQVRLLGRDKQEVYTEWLKKIGDRRTLLSDPKDSFNKAVSPKRSKRK
jgi:hypothetical protein